MFTRPLFFEVAEDGADLATGGAGDEATAVTPEAETGTEAEVVTPEAPAGIDFSSPEFQQAVAEHSQQYGAQAAEAYVNDLIAQAEAAQAQQFELPEFDPTNPGSYTEGLLGLVRQEFQQALAPLIAAQEQQQMGEAHQIADQMAASQPELKEINDLLPEDKREGVSSTIRALAEGFYPSASERYGDTPQAAQAAMRAASGHMLEMTKAAHAAGKAAHKAELENLSGATAEPSGTTGAAQLGEMPKDELEAARRFMARQS